MRKVFGGLVVMGLLLSLAPMTSWGDTVTIFKGGKKISVKQAEAKEAGEAVVVSSSVASDDTVIPAGASRPERDKAGLIISLSPASFLSGDAIVGDPLQVTPPGAQLPAAPGDEIFIGMFLYIPQEVREEMSSLSELNWIVTVNAQGQQIFNTAGAAPSFNVGPASYAKTTNVLSVHGAGFSNLPVVGITSADGLGAGLTSSISKPASIGQVNYVFSLANGDGQLVGTGSHPRFYYLGEISLRILSTSELITQVKGQPPIVSQVIAVAERAFYQPAHPVEPVPERYSDTLTVSWTIRETKTEPVQVGYQRVQGISPNGSSIPLSNLPMKGWYPVFNPDPLEYSFPAWLVYRETEPGVWVSANGDATLDMSGEDRNSWSMQLTPPEGTDDDSNYLVAFLTQSDGLPVWDFNIDAHTYAWAAANMDPASFGVSGGYLTGKNNTDGEPGVLLRRELQVQAGGRWVHVRYELPTGTSGVSVTLAAVGQNGEVIGTPQTLRVNNDNAISLTTLAGGTSQIVHGLNIQVNGPVGTTIKVDYVRVDTE